MATEELKTIAENSGAAAAPAAKPTPKPAPAPAAPAENEVKPLVVAPEELRATLEKLHAEGMDFLECLTGFDWMEEGLGCIYTLTSTTTGKI